MKSKVAGTSINRGIYGKEGKLQESQLLITNNASYCWSIFLAGEGLDTVGWRYDPQAGLASTRTACRVKHSVYEFHRAALWNHNLPPQQRLRVRLASGTDHLLHQEPRTRITLRNMWRLRQWSSRYSCGIPRIFKVRRDIDSKLSSSEFLLVVKPEWCVNTDGCHGWIREQRDAQVARVVPGITSHWRVILSAT